MQHFRGQDSILTNGYPPEVDRVYCQKFLHQVTFSSPISPSALLVVDWMRTIIKGRKKSAWVQQLCAALPVVPMSLRVMRRDVCVGPTVCASRRFSPERQWWAQVSDSLLFTRRVPHADTKRERRRLDNFSIIRRRLALSVWIPLPKSNVTCVITTQSRVQLISVCDEERVDIFPRSLISGKKQLK